MPLTVTPSLNPEFPLSVPAPLDLELANAASLLQFVQPLEDGVECARRGIYGLGRGTLYNVDYAPFNATFPTPFGGDVVFWPRPTVALLNWNNKWTVYPATTSFSYHDLNTLIGAAPAANTTYYLYLYESAPGTLSYMASASVPNGSYTYMNANDHYLYIGKVMTDNVGEVIPFRQRGLDDYWTWDMPNVGNQISVHAYTRPVTVVKIAPLGYIRVLSATNGTWEDIPLDPTSALYLPNVVTLSGGVAPNTRYYIYAYKSADRIAFEVDTTAPYIPGVAGVNVAPRWKNSGADGLSRVYISTFLTDNNGDIIEWSDTNTKYTYNRLTTNIGFWQTGNLIFDPGTVTTGGWVAVAVSFCVPVFATTFTVRLRTINDVGADGTLVQGFIRETNSNDYIVASALCSVASRGEHTVDGEFSNPNTLLTGLEYQIINPAGIGRNHACVTGWTQAR